MARKRKSISPAALLMAAALLVAVWAVSSPGCNARQDQRAGDGCTETGAVDSSVLPLRDDGKDAAGTLPANEADEREEDGAEELPRGIEIPRYESSRGGQTIRHTGFTLSYDADYKTPQWVAWTLTRAMTLGTEKRSNKFCPDPSVRGAQAYTKDYTGSGYDRGHMAPAGDMKWSRQAMAESFYLSNVCPQNRNLNRGDWKDLEELTREWAAAYGSVSVAAGPIYATKYPARIGANKVAVPDAFFKVVLVGYPKNPKAYGFIFRNEAGSRPLSYYQLSVDEVERRTGMDFFSALPDKVEQRIEAETPALP